MWSPLVAETVVWYLRRWTLAYLRIKDQQQAQKVVIPPNIAHEFIDNGAFGRTVDFLLNKVGLNITKANYEHDVAHKVNRVYWLTYRSIVL